MYRFEVDWHPRKDDKKSLLEETKEIKNILIE